jgi:hypothetical protein
MGDLITERCREPRGDADQRPLCMLVPDGFSVGDSLRFKPHRRLRFVRAGCFRPCDFLCTAYQNRAVIITAAESTARAAATAMVTLSFIRSSLPIQ